MGDSHSESTAHQRWQAELEKTRKTLSSGAAVPPSFAEATEGVDAQAISEGAEQQKTSTLRFDSGPTDIAHASPTNKPSGPLGALGNRYADIERVGEGSFGVVYRAVDSVLGRTVAIKVIKQALPVQVRERFKLEAQRLAMLEHPGICSVYDFSAVGPLSYLVTEWLAGKSLAQEPRPVDSLRACRLMAQVAEAVAYAHRNEVIHRDLKPANVMLDSHGRARVIDFGLSVSESELDSSQIDICGSPAYMAPEQIDGRLHVLDGRVDVWAMGVMLYELVAGKRPFRGEKSSDLLSKIRDKPVTSPRTFTADIPSTVERIIFKCLAKAPDDRYATAADLACDLNAFLSEQPRMGMSSNPTAAAVASAPGSATRVLPTWTSSYVFYAVVSLAITAVALTLGWQFSVPGVTASKVLESGGEENEPSASSIGPPVKPAATAGSQLAVLGHRAASGQQWRISLEDPISPDIRSGDQVSVLVELPRPSHIYLIWLGDDTGITLLYPGPLGSTSFVGDPAVDKAIDSLRLPVGTITPTPSTETVLLLATETAFANGDELVQLISRLPRPDIRRFVKRGENRGMHFNIADVEATNTVDPLMRSSFKPFLEELKNLPYTLVSVQAVSFVSGDEQASGRTTE